MCEKEVNFFLQSSSNDCFFVYGPSGIGKTTLVRILAGLSQPLTGQIIINNNVWFDSEQKINLAPQQRSISYVSQEYTLFPHMTVLENILFSIRNSSAKAKEIARLLSVFKLARYKNTKPHLLSGGQQQRVAIIRALVKDSALLLFDEPFSGQDSALKKVLRQEIKKIHKKNNTITIFISHDMSEGLLLSNYILFMNASSFFVVKNDYQQQSGLLPIIAEVTRSDKNGAVELSSGEYTFTFTTSEILNIGDRVLVPLKPLYSHLKKIK
ncbi:ABC transporter ATP-binding protein [Candidatus Uabimicrobium sp. HlEnr_7]|uniref:ABC transporter ATP-binding protein n=1 Tax=Candidatus Uabimicrobium helgolandensis TaxID=3095367 RepID=UPI00355669D0